MAKKRFRGSVGGVGRSSSGSSSSSGGGGRCGGKWALRGRRRAGGVLAQWLPAEDRADFLAALPAANALWATSKKTVLLNTMPPARACAKPLPA
jgi:hypothetical protein